MTVRHVDASIAPGCLFLVTGLLVASQQRPAVSATPDALTLESKIPLGDVSGRIDHLAVDLAHHRMFSSPNSATWSTLPKEPFFTGFPA